MRRLALIPALFLAACGSAPQPDAALRSLVDDYLRETFRSDPVQATAAGLHSYDGELPTMSRDEIAGRIRQLRAQLARLEGIDRTRLRQQESIDARFLDGQIRSQLQSLETFEEWRTNPMAYAALPGSAIDLLIKREFASKQERLRAVTSRLKKIPAVFDSMRANVSNPPKEFTDLAIRIASGSKGFFEGALAKWAADAAPAGSPELAAFTQANQQTVHSFERAVQWLRQDLLPRSQGRYAIGANEFRKKLLYDELLDMPLDQVLATGERNLERDYRDFVETARSIDPRKTPAEVMAMLSNTHPSADDLIPSTRKTVEGVRRFVMEKQLFTLPSEAQPLVQETPPYARNGSFASMDSPGPFEEKASEAFYYVTPPENDWGAKQREEHLRLFNPWVTEIVTIHEVFPGHFTQFLFVKQFPTPLRRFAAVGSNAEGWAHYAEQMMIEQGFGGGDPRYRLAQLSEALLRDCRYVAGIKLHTQGWTVEQATRLFVEKGFQEPANAFEEARRGAYNPTYLYYTLGKLMIYKLRLDLQQQMGPRFRLREFHDQFVRQGGLPIPLLREILLPGDTGSPL